MPAKSPLSIAESGTMIGTSSSGPWMNARIASGWTLKELAPLRYMPYVARCFQETIGHHLKDLACIPDGLGPGVTTIGR